MKLKTCDCGESTCSNECGLCAADKSVGQVNNTLKSEPAAVTVVPPEITPEQAEALWLSFMADANWGPEGYYMQGLRDATKHLNAAWLEILAGYVRERFASTAK